jgi:hypothetical protein
VVHSSGKQAASRIVLLRAMGMYGCMWTKQCSGHVDVGTGGWGCVWVCGWGSGTRAVISN